MKKTKLIRSVAPLYWVALVCVAASFLLHVHTLVGWLVTATVSAGGYFVARRIWPDKTVEVMVPVPPRDEEIAALMEQRDAALGEMRRINQRIPDEDITAQIDRIEAATEGIFRYILEHPEKKNQINRFQDYYLPTTVRLLTAYDRMKQLPADGEHVSASKRRIEEALEVACQGYERQLDALYQDEAMDIAADSVVLQNMMKQQGLLGSDF